MEPGFNVTPFYDWENEESGLDKVMLLHTLSYRTIILKSSISVNISRTEQQRLAEWVTQTSGKNCNAEPSQQHPKQCLLLYSQTAVQGPIALCCTFPVIPQHSWLAKIIPIIQSLLTNCHLAQFLIFWGGGRQGGVATVKKKLTHPHYSFSLPIARSAANKKESSPYKGKQYKGKRNFWQRLKALLEGSSKDQHPSGSFLCEWEEAVIQNILATFSQYF